MTGGIGWLGIVRLGLVQSALGAIVVLATSTLNRVMVVEYALLATVPGALVTWHHALQFLRPRWGYGSDMGGARTPWIIGGMGVLGAGGVLAAYATPLLAEQPVLGGALAILAFTLIGIGVGAAGTCLLALLATKVIQARRAAAATIVWLMMIAGFAVTAGLAGQFLDPYSPERLLLVCSVVAGLAFVVSIVALWGMETRGAVAPEPAAEPDPDAAEKVPFLQALPQVWGEDRTRRFAVFVFVSMLAYSAQDLILEPFGGIAFNMTPGQTTQLAGIQHGGVFLGMALVGLMGSLFKDKPLGSLRMWTIGGCFASAAALAGLVVGGSVGEGWPIQQGVFVLGVSTGAFAVAAIGSMMGLAGQGQPGREGMRMGVWGAAQAIAFGLGGFLGTLSVDVSRALIGAATPAYQAVFAAEAVLFLVSAALAARVGRIDAPTPGETADERVSAPMAPGGDQAKALAAETGPTG